MSPARPARRRILFAWELGANYGHAAQIDQVAEALPGNVDIYVAASDLAAFRAIAPNPDLRLLPAPRASVRRPTTGDTPAVNLSGLLATEGWDDPVDLATRIEAWRTIFRLTRPDAIVCQAAPTAMLAALGGPSFRVTLGAGYDVPPSTDPLPAFDREDETAKTAAIAADAVMLENINYARARVGEAPLARLSEVFDADLTLLMTWEVADHFAPRSELEPHPPPYLGALATTQTGARASWRGGTAPKIFAYLRPGMPGTAAALGALDALASSADIILAIPGVSATDLQRLQARGVQVYDGPVRLKEILAKCDLAITHGSNGLGTLLLSHGVPQICLPGHIEQTLFTKAIARSGAGLGLGGQYTSATVAKLCQKCLQSKRIKQKAAEISAEIGAKTPSRAAKRAAESILELVNAKRP
ncbi:hypothetical protein SAMN05421688_3203 [Poseidonocella pacifica]|uniref:Erythromycin biosynthesis protein CIII-like C-terminal domain-containing protein n=1 Tax=Poseidonocella pacifica TaxID=871651 RepID=A0A1I0YMA9_9RHOB|nr:nucleotide disphospho-sugar-binding domain-containing protein [Poseidonocella pacifica]SFB14341.1 hypothetical protein SAMN05421688_3203 [Poseidonocella pacifica]